MSQDKAPEWAEKEAGTLALDYVDWLGRDKVDRDAEHVLTSIVAQALSQAYERGQESMRERASKELDAWKMSKASDKVRSLPIEQEGGE